jgi:hypothetical protein
MTRLGTGTREKQNPVTFRIEEFVGLRVDLPVTGYLTLLNVDRTHPRHEIPGSTRVWPRWLAPL